MPQEGEEVEFDLRNKQRVSGKARRTGRVSKLHFKQGETAPFLYTVAYRENGVEKTTGLKPAWVRPVPTEVK